MFLPFSQSFYDLHIFYTPVYSTNTQTSHRLEQPPSAFCIYLLALLFSFFSFVLSRSTSRRVVWDVVVIAWLEILTIGGANCNDIFSKRGRFYWAKPMMVIVDNSTIYLLILFMYSFIIHIPFFSRITSSKYKYHIIIFPYKSVDFFTGCIISVKIGSTPTIAWNTNIFLVTTPNHNSSYKSNIWRLHEWGSSIYLWTYKRSQYPL